MFLVYNDVSFHGIYHSIQATADYIAAGVICMSLTLWLFSHEVWRPIIPYSWAVFICVNTVHVLE